MLTVNYNGALHCSSTFAKEDLKTMPTRLFKAKVPVFHTLVICSLVAFAVYLVVEKKFEEWSLEPCRVNVYGDKSKLINANSI